MGRSCYFAFENIYYPTEVPGVSDILGRCKTGDRITIKLDNEFSPPFPARSPSTYGNIPTPLPSTLDGGTTYTIIDNDYESISEYSPEGKKHVCALFVEPVGSDSRDDLIQTWIITTDGYVREIEAYTVIEKIMWVALEK